MPTWNFGGATYNTTDAYCGPWGAGDNFWYTDGYGMPTARTALGGNQPIYISDITGVYAEGPVTDVTIVYQSVETSGGSSFASSGGTTQLRFRFNGGGTVRPGRNTANGLVSICNRTGTPRTGGMPGNMTWAQVATAPQSLNVLTGLSSAQLRVNFAGPADNGGLAVTNYTIQYSATGTGGPWTTYGTTTSGTNVLTMPAAGTPYAIRVYTNNGLGSSVPSTFGSMVMSGGGGQRYNGSAWIDLSTARRYTGSTWTPLVTRKRYTGSAWTDILN